MADSLGGWLYWCLILEQPASSTGSTRRAAASASRPNPLPCGLPVLPALSALLLPVSATLVSAPLRLGPVELPNRLFVAPMAGVTDRPFRMLCKRLGAGYAVSEMVTSKRELWSSLKTSRRANHDGETETNMGRCRTAALFTRAWAIADSTAAHR